MIEVLSDRDTPLTVHLLVRESVFKGVRDDFLIASLAAELDNEGILSIRTTDAETTPLLITDEAVVSVVSSGDQVAGLTLDDAEFVASAHEQWNDQWENAEDVSLRTPGRRQVIDTLSGEFGSAVASDFQTILGSLATARGDDEVDKVVVALLAAAKNEELLYDISKWGEDVGLASKATFSRMKTNLEQRGLIETEKVPIDIGRPRLRLVLGNDQLREADSEDIASVAQSLLSSTAL